MTNLIRVVTDSTCDLPQRLLERLRIAVVPLMVRFGEEVYSEDQLSLDEFWEKAAGPHHPHTSQPPVGAFVERFERLVDQGKQVLCLTITGKHSGTLNAARLAAERFGDAVHVFDSLSISLGLGLQAMAAARAAEAGRSMEEIVDSLRDLRERMRLTILLDNLENVRRGGRADAFISVVDRMARALNIKPIINVVEGQLKLVGVTRSFRRGMRRVFDTVAEMGLPEHLAVIHTRSPGMAEEVAERLAELVGFPRERVWLRETGPALACHAGAGVIGVLAVPRSVDL